MPKSSRHLTPCLVGQRHFESPIRHKILFRLTLRPSTFPSPPKSGEKVADRPDEGPVQDVNLRKKPPHPSPLRQFVCDHTAKKNHAISANKSGERGQRIRQSRTVELQEMTIREACKRQFLPKMASAVVTFRILRREDSLSGPEIRQIGRCWQKLVYMSADNNHSNVRKRRRWPPALRLVKPG